MRKEIGKQNGRNLAQMAKNWICLKIILSLLHHEINSLPLRAPSNEGGFTRLKLFVGSFGEISSWKISSRLPSLTPCGIKVPHSSTYRALIFGWLVSNPVEKLSSCRQTTSWTEETVTYNIVDKTNWFWSWTNSKGAYEAASFWVQQTVTVHIVLFNVRAQMFLLVSCSYPFQYLCVLCTVKANKQATGNKNL